MLDCKYPRGYWKRDSSGSGTWLQSMQSRCFTLWRYRRWMPGSRWGQTWPHSGYSVHGRSFWTSAPPLLTGSHRSRRFGNSVSCPTGEFCVFSLGKYPLQLSQGAANHPMCPWRSECQMLLCAWCYASIRLAGRLWFFDGFPHIYRYCPVVYHSPVLPRHFCGSLDLYLWVQRSQWYWQFLVQLQLRACHLDCFPCLCPRRDSRLLKTYYIALSNIVKRFSDSFLYFTTLKIMKML